MNRTSPTTIASITICVCFQTPPLQHRTTTPALSHHHTAFATAQNHHYTTTVAYIICVVGLFQRLENTLNYGLERVWVVGYMKGSRQIVIGYNEGTIMVKIGREEPVASMDNSGKIIWAKHNEIHTINIKSVGADHEVSDGERLPLAVKELGTCDIYPQVSFFSDDEETTSTPKTDALFIPRENPRALVIRPLKRWPGKSSAEKLKNASSPAQTNGDYTGNHSENGTLKEQTPIKTPQKQNGGCDGGEMEDGFEFIVKNKGINIEVAYPYQATDGTCNTKDEVVHAATITGYEKVPANSESALLQAVANQLLSVAIDASGMGFQFYSGGVFTGDFGTDLDHGVTSLLNQMELYVVVYILAILGLDSLQGIMLDQGSCIDTCCTFCRKVWIAYKESRYEKLQWWDDALKAYIAKSAQATSQRLILDATLGNSYCSVFIPNPKFFGWRKGSQELSEQGFNISLKEV
ncbi:unnamed protein product [Lactuca saligna]|uniref:Peptidase C1A papain C-terminal domain-containing protein n=1 Tax=Lactuca saligna TaxID=75948 RepID=A0AA35ZEU2_LACSI|nr:unnamed protein product [Lactuca saligna]CAI9290825.1 unnamed protein product [Lactuca saligna]